MNSDELGFFLEENTFVDNWNRVYGNGFELVAIATNDTSILQWLIANGYPVVYSSVDGAILVKFE